MHNKNNFVRVKVKDIALYQAGGFHIVLEDAEGKRIDMIIGQSEGISILMAIEKKEYVRPLTHDLIKNILDGLEVSLEKVLITELKNNTYYARIILKTGNKILSIDARPSDSIALALRCKSPIFVEESLLRKGNSQHNS